jgi:hypothetical protein
MATCIRLEDLHACILRDSAQCRDDYVAMIICMRLCSVAVDV